MASFEHDAVVPAAQDGDDKKQQTDHGHGHSHDHSHGHTSAKIVALGTVNVGGATFSIDREGQVEAGAETEFGVELVGSASAVPSAAWLANPDGKKICDPVSAEDHNQHWHFTVAPLYPVKKSKFVLQVGGEEVSVDWHRGAEPCDDGILSVFKVADAPDWRGFLELKQHGDAGDLELWLYESYNVSNWSASGSKPDPFDVPKETVVHLTFPSHEGRKITLSVRNMDQNEDEEGKPNMRDGRTNYFIFPGESGQDQEWLMGEKWRGTVTVAFEAGGKSYSCDPFVLVPHEAL